MGLDFALQGSGFGVRGFKGPGLWVWGFGVHLKAGLGFRGFLA